MTATRDNSIAHVRLMVGMEVHVELATRTKMFTRVANPAAAHAGSHHADAHDPHAMAPNTLIDPVVLALPGALPVMNLAAVEMSIKVGLALNCAIAPRTKWDRKSYFYPDLPKAYQISQYDLPICFDGSLDVPGTDDQGRIDPALPSTRIGIIRAHLEEDAGKLLHEAPGGHAIDGSIVDLNRAGTPLLEIVTQPDFTSADQCVAFARTLRNICRFLGVSEGVMQRGHMRFEPNINCVLTLHNGHTVKTPIVEVKNLNSFKSLKGAIEFEAAEQPRRWLADGREMGRGMKTTRGWDDARATTFIQREKEDAHDYRYFPDPDLPPVIIDQPWIERLRAQVPELPPARFARYVNDYGLGAKEAAALVDERDTCVFYEATVEQLVARGIERLRAGKLAANFLLQSGAKRANERGVMIHELGIAPGAVAAVAALREQGRVNPSNADELFGLLCDDPGASAEALATSRGMLIVRDDAAMKKWIEQAVSENAQAAADVRAGKHAALGRLVGAAMKLSGGSADAKTIREELLKHLGQ